MWVYGLGIMSIYILNMTGDVILTLSIQRRNCIGKALIQSLGLF